MEFSISDLSSVTESDGSFSVCSVMAMTSPVVTLAVEVTVSLFTMDGTGTMKEACQGKSLIWGWREVNFTAREKVRKSGKYKAYLFTATSGSGDYEPLAEPVTFPAGSADGAEMCVSVSVNSDHLVEAEENVTVRLALVTAGTGFALGNATSTIALIDSDGMSHLTVAEIN